MRGILALYYRLSLADSNKDKADPSNSIKNQQSMLKEYVRNHPELMEYEIKEFVDDGYSGTNFKRPSIQKIFSLMKEGKVTCIVVKDFSRFGRNYIEVGTYLEQILPFLKVRFISVTDEFDSKKDNAAGAIDVGFKSLMHDYYSKNMGHKIAQAKQFRAREGTIIMPAFFGYKKEKNSNRIVIDEEAASVVRMIFEKRNDGMLITDITKYLNAQGVFTPSLRKSQLTGTEITKAMNWSPDKVTAILKDVRYTGVLIFGKKRSVNFKEKKMPESEWLSSDNYYEPIISKELFENVGKTLYKRNTFKEKQRQKRDNTMFCGKLKCGHCGHPLYRRDVGYRCKTRFSFNAVDCPDVTFKEDIFVNVVLKALNQLLSVTVPETKELVYSEKKSDLTSKLKNQLSKCKNESLCLYEKYSDGKLEKSEYISNCKTLEIKRLNIEQEIAKIEKENEQIGEKKKIISILSSNLYNGIIKELTPKIVDEFVDKIIVYDEEHMDILWKYNDILKCRG